MSLVVRPARPGDGEGLAQAAIDFSTYYIDLDPERFRSPAGGLVAWFETELGKPMPEGGLWLVAETGGLVVGSVEATILDPRDDAAFQPQVDLGLRRAYVNYLAVQTEYRNRGIGSRLMDAAEGWARENGVVLMLTDTRLRGLSVRFYEKNGYAQQAVILRKRLA